MNSPLAADQTVLRYSFSTSSSQVRVFEYGARVDPECWEHVHDQMRRGRDCYNAIAAAINHVIDDAYAWLAEQAGDEMQQLSQRISTLNDAWMAARALDDRTACEAVAAERQSLRARWYQLLHASKRKYAAKLRERWLSQVGQRRECVTYQIRSSFVAQGLDWAVANAALRAALQAFGQCWPRNRQLSFRQADHPDQSLELQFTGAGGLSVAKILAEQSRGIGLDTNSAVGRRRLYVPFYFSVGSGLCKKSVTGTVQYHRSLPKDGAVGFARLVERRIGKDLRHYLQFSVRLKTIDEPKKRSSAMAVLHLGWRYMEDGRRIGEIAQGPRVNETERIVLPSEILEGLNRSRAAAGTRDVLRDAIVPMLKKVDLLTVPEKLSDDFKGIRRLPVQHIAPRRLAMLAIRWPREAPTWEIDVMQRLEMWRKQDRLLWQASAHGARRARFARRKFYEGIALNIVRRFGMVLIDSPNLKNAAIVKNPDTGKHAALGSRARSGRFDAALYEFKAALRSAGEREGCTVGEVSGPTSSNCSSCGGAVKDFGTGFREVVCDECGVVLDRAANAATWTWQRVSADHKGCEDAISLSLLEDAQRAESARHRKELRAQARKTARRTTGAAEGTND